MAKEAKETKKKAGGEKKGFFARIAKFFKDTRGEIKRIVWPDRNKVMHDTWVVIACVLACAVIIWGFDTILTFIVNFLFKLA